MIDPQAFLFGFTQGFVIGPMTLFGIREGLDPRKGFWFQVQVILGATVVDIVYLLLSSYGVAQFIQQDIVKLIMWCIASYMLLTMGYHSFFEKQHKLSYEHVHRHRTKFYETDFFRALLLNITNPLAIVFWFVVAGSLYTQAVTPVSPFIFAMNIVVGGTLSSLIVALATLVVKHIFHQWMLKKLVKAGSLILVGYGFYFTFQALLILKPMVVALLKL